MGMYVVGKNEKRSLLIVTGSVKGIKLNCIVDSGATDCVMSNRIARKFAFPILKYDVKINVADNRMFKVVFEFLKN